MCRLARAAAAELTPEMAAPVSKRQRRVWPLTETFTMGRLDNEERQKSGVVSLLDSEMTFRSVKMGSKRCCRDEPTAGVPRPSFPEGEGILPWR